MKNLKITEWYAAFIRRQVQPGDLCCDATMGNGNDTLLLSQLCQSSGHVYAFDIQSSALQRTKALLAGENAPENYELHLESHVNMDRYIEPDSLSCVVFNFGYLPGGDHTISTTAAESLDAIKKALPLLRKEGLMVLCIYRGGDTGYEESLAILDLLKKLDPHKYLVIRSDYYNRPNDPPIPVLVCRLK